MSAGVASILSGAGKVLADLGVMQKGFIVMESDAAGGIEVGDLEELQVVGGEPVSVRVMAVDTISKPMRAKVERVDDGQVLTVPMFPSEDIPTWRAAQDAAGSPAIGDDALHSGHTTVYQDYEESFAAANVRAETAPSPAIAEGAAADANSGVAATIVDALSQEVNATVQDFKEKGAVGMLKDASLDAVDLAREAFGAACDGAGMLASAALGEREAAGSEKAQVAAAGA